MDRAEKLKKWVASQLYNTMVHLEPLTGDASFRRYFRVHRPDGNLVAVDAPPEKENNQAFVALANSLGAQGVQVPSVIAHDFDLGFMLLSDFGDDVFLNKINNDNLRYYYQKAIDALISLHHCVAPSDYQIQKFDASFIRLEIERTEDWYFSGYLQWQPTITERTTLNDVYDKIINNAEEQPLVLVHRDYHSRNLLILPDETLGIIDFQDAVWGPITYDLMSLLRDCYITLPSTFIQDKLISFKKSMISLGKIDISCSDATFRRWFDWMGIQRHIKVLGIFSRIYLRDSNSRYLAYIPRVLDYLVSVSFQYKELKAFNKLLQEVIIFRDNQLNMNIKNVR